MKTILKKRIPVVLSLFAFWLVSTLSCGLPFSGPAPSAAARTPPAESRAAVKTALTRAPAAAPKSTATEAAAAAADIPTVTAAPTRPSQPLVAASYCILADCSQYTYPGDESNGIRGGTGGIMLAIPGQIWIANDDVGIQQWDPQTGSLVKTIPNTVENDFTDIKYDGSQLWVYALVSHPPSNNHTVHTGVLYDINPLQGELVKKIDIPNDQNSSEGGEDNALGYPNIGLSPGKVWVKDRIIDAQTFKPLIMQYNFAYESHFAYDGQGLMWDEGENCGECPHGIWLYDVKDPTKTPIYTGLTDYPDLTNHHNLIMAGGKMWATARYWKKADDQTSYWEILAYDLHKNDKPLIQTDVSREMTGRNGGEIFSADNHAIWLAPNRQDGIVYDYDQASGRLLGSLHVGTTITSMSFDGQALWVMDVEYGLQKIALPWAP